MRWPVTRLAELLGVRYPIVQAPMAGGPTTPALVAAVSNAGALGSIGGATLAPDELREAIRRVRELTGRPFAVNLFAPHERGDADAETTAAIDAELAPLRRGLGLPAPERETVAVPPSPYEAQVAVVVEERVPVFSFTFGLPPLEEIRASGAIVLGTATTVAEAALLEDAGVQAVVAQGAEAGGHRGTFAAPFERALVGTIALVPQIVDRVGVPVVAAGGIGDGRGVAAALALGADGAQIGTAFLTCAESGVPDSYQRALLSAGDSDTMVTRAGSGRFARALRTPLLESLEGLGTIAPYPAQALLVRDLRAAGVELDRADLLFLLAGQAAPLARAMPAAALVETLVAETAQALR